MRVPDLQERKMPEDIVLLSAVRTAIGKYGGSLRDVSAPRLGAAVIGEAVSRAGIEAEAVDEVIMGNVISAGLGQNPARQAAVHAGIPLSVGSFTVNKVCGSGLKAVMLAAQAIKAGDAEIVVAGGMENMSSAPHLLEKLRWGVRSGDASLVDAMVRDGLQDAYHSYHMGMTGERTGHKYGITREEADEFSLRSHQKAARARRSGKFLSETVGVPVGSAVFDTDECVREDTSIEKLSKLAPAFQKGGILTAGNSSQLADGAAAVLVASGRIAAEMDLTPLARIAGYAVAGTAPEDVMEAPVPAVRKLLAKTGFTINDMDLVEHNEAFSVASMAVCRELEIDPDRFNIHGGAVAMGHPIGASGARILVTLVHALAERGLKRGLATLCLGGGNAVAMIIER
jgi:acetyl-CoA C-acetyltransferase